MKGPYGVFMLREKSNSDIICIGGGSGMTLLWSLLNDMAERGIERKATYYYGARTRKDLFYLDRLRQLAERLPGFRFVPALSMATAEDEWNGETGMITDVLDRNQGMLPILEKITQQGKREIVMIAEDVDGEALATLVVNKLRGILNVLAIRGPAFGDRRKEILRDIAVLTGGQVISEEMGRRLENATLADLGSARLVVAHKDDVTIIEGRGKAADIQARMRQLRRNSRIPPATMTARSSRNAWRS